MEAKVSEFRHGHKVQRKAQVESEVELSDSFAHALEETGTGIALPDEFCADAEVRFGVNFRSVRLHIDEAADATARLVNARAFTLGNDIYFARGEFQPNAEAGKRLLAHELTHVIQGGGLHRFGMTRVSERDDSAEREAEVVAEDFVEGRRIAVHQVVDPNLVHRDPEPPMQTEDLPNRIVRLVRQANDREATLRACLEGGKRWDDVQRAWENNPYPQSLLAAAMNFPQGAGDAARVYAYLRYGALRLADKLFIAGIGLGTDKESIFRLLPAVNADLADTTTKFFNSYGTTGGDSFGVEYESEAPLLTGQMNRIAGFLTEELSGADLVKALALVSYGDLRPIDEIQIALVSLVPSNESIMKALEKVRVAAEGRKSTAETDFENCYRSNLRSSLRGHLGDRDMQRAQLILDGNFTPYNRIKIACQAWVVDTSMIWDALDDATNDERKALKEQWDQNQSDGIRPMIEGKLTISAAEVKRVEAILRQGSSMNDRLAEVGVEVHDIQGVIRAALKSDRVREAFIGEYPRREDFYRDFTGGGTIGAAMLWGGQLVSADWGERLGLAVEMRSDEGVRDVLENLVKSDDDRAVVRANRHLMAAMREMNWMTIEPLVAPREDLQARAKWLGERFDVEKGRWGDSASAAAFGDEKRELDMALSQAADPAHLTDDERSNIEVMMSSTEAAFNAFILVRDQLDAIAIQAASAAAGLFVTMLTGGAGGPVAAGLLARVALTQGCVEVASLWVVKQERITGAEAARAFAVGAASGVTGAMTGSALQGLGKPLVDEAARLAGSMAETRFSDIGLKTMNSAMEGLVSSSVGSVVDTASREETWRKGFLDGLGTTLEGAFVGGTQGALTGATLRLVTEAITLARMGKVPEAGKAMDELEGKLPAEQAALLRRELNAQMQEKLGRPPGRAEATADQEAALKLSGRGDGDRPLNPQELKNELDVVRRSEPQPSTVHGYIDEVDLGNGHTWRRETDGWCRFSRKRCGFTIDNPPPVSERTRSKIRATHAAIESDLDLLRSSPQLSSKPDVIAMTREATAIRRIIDAGDLAGAVLRLEQLRDRVAAALRLPIPTPNEVENELSDIEKRGGRPSTARNPAAPVGPRKPLPLNFKALLDEAWKSMRAEVGSKKMFAPELGTRLHAHMAKILGQETLPPGWRIAVEEPIGASVNVGKSTVREWLAGRGNPHGLLQQLPTKVLDQQVANLKPDLVMWEGTMAAVWDLTSVSKSEHLAKTLLYSEIVSKDNELMQIVEMYWSGAATK